MSGFVVPHDPTWRAGFDAEAAALKAALGDMPLVLHHIGSTAIPGIHAKPIIDLLGEVDDLAALGSGPLNSRRSV